MPKRKFTATQGGSAKRSRRGDHSKIVKLTRMIAQPKKHTTSSFPPSMRVKQRYFDFIACDGVNLGTLFNVNSTYDPDRTLTGHQPNGRDTMATIYAKYKVHGCYVKVKFVATTVGAYLCALAPVNNAATLSGDMRVVIETPGSKYTACDINGGSKQLTMYVDCAKVAGVSKAAYENDSLYSQTIANNPAEIMTLGVYWTKVDGTALTAGYVYAEVELIYDVTYYDQELLALS